MGTVTKTLADGSTVDFDTKKYTPESIDRSVNSFNARWTAAQTGPQVPTGDTSEVSPTVLQTPDPSETDSVWWDWPLKNAGAALHGTATGAGQIADFVGNYSAPLVASAGDILSGRMPKKEYFPTDETYQRPAENAIRSMLPDAPEGSDYEATRGVSEILGPILVTEALSGGAATPAALARLGTAGLGRRLATAGMETLVKPILKTPVIAGSSIVGGQTGGAVGEMVGGDTGRTLGEILGTVALPTGAVPAVKALANKFLTVADSPGRLAAIERLNEKLPEGFKIPATMGLVGSKGIGSLEDVTARGIVSGEPAFKARSDLYKGLEKRWIDLVETSRGRSSGTPDSVTGRISESTITPEPSTGQISKETIGGETAHAAEQGIKNAKQLRKAIQDALENDIGAGTSVDPGPFYDAMDKVMARVKDRKLRAQAQQLIDDFNTNIPRNQPLTRNKKGTVTGGSAITPNPEYAAVQQRRSDVGRTLNPEGQGIKKGFTDQAYKGMTDAMRGTAKKQGVSEARFNEDQANTERLYRDIEGMKPSVDAKHSGGAFDTLFSGSGKQSIEPLLPFIRHAPDATSRVLANVLDWRMRGAKGRAGISDPDPINFDIGAPRRALTEGVDPDYLRTLTGDIPEVEQAARDIALVARADEIRPGKRSVPGGPGSTIGTLALPGVGTALGAASGYLAHPNGGLASVLSGAVGALGGGITGELSTLGLGKLLTNPDLVRAVVNPQNSAGLALRRALQAASAETNYGNQKQQQSRDQQQVDEFNRAIMGQ